MTAASDVGAGDEEWKRNHAEHVDSAHAVREGRLLRNRRQAPALTDGGWSDKQRTADGTEAGLAKQDAANWAHGEKHERASWASLRSSSE